jgi:hypothetical protein
LFSLLLTDTTFSWFSALLPGSVLAWYDLENKFHEYFYSRDNDLKLSHLTSVKKKQDESVTDYVKRFRETKNHGNSSVISENDMAELVLSGLWLYLKENLKGFDFLTVGQVLQKALAQESRANESRIPIRWIKSSVCGKYRTLMLYCYDPQGVYKEVHGGR